jgi:hypothetical protein
MADSQCKGRIFVLDLERVVTLTTHIVSITWRGAALARDRTTILYSYQRASGHTMSQQAAPGNYPARCSSMTGGKRIESRT